MSFEQKNPENLKEKKERKKKIVFVDESSNVEAEAMDRADAKMTASKEDLKGIKRMWKRVWHHNLAHPYYRRKEYEKSKKEILERKNLYGNEEEKKAHEEALVKQFTSEYEEAIHTEAGEKRETLGNNEQENFIKSQVKELISSYAKGEVDEANFREAESRLFNEIKGAKKEIIDKGDLYASNLLEIAKQVKQSLEHGEAIDNLDFDIVVGKAKSDIRTEAGFNKLDKVINKLQGSRLGSLVNETTISTAASIAYCSGAYLSKRFANSKMLAWGSFGATALLGSGIAAAREKKRLEEERRQHGREMAQGQKIEKGSKRREEMEQFRHETKGANELADNLEYSLYNFNEKGEREIKSLDEDAFDDVIGKLNEIEARIKISDQQKIDLIDFSDKSKVSEERLRLDLLRAKAKIDLRKMVEEGKVQMPGGKSFEEMLELSRDARIANLTKGEEGIEKKNELFKKMRNKKVCKAGLKGLVTGLVIGGAAQEIGAFFRDGQEGLLENMFESKAYADELKHVAPGVKSYTILEYARHWIDGDFPRMDASKIHEFIVGNNHIKLPEGANLIQNSDGTYNLLRGEDVVGEHLKFNSDGSLTEEAKKILEGKGVKFDSDVVKAGPKDIVEGYEKLTSKIKRTLWYDNDTPKPVFDKNELKMWWGGAHGTGVDANGNYVLDVKHMAPDGSFHGKFSIDAQKEMENGKLKMLFSLSRDTQNQVFEIPIDANGNAVIDPNSEVGKLFFAEEGGKAIFKGKFAEVAEMMGKNKDGAEMTRILSTLEGEGIKDSMIPFTVFDVPQDYYVEPPPVIPIGWRTPLEKARPRETLPPYYLNYNAPADMETEKLFTERRSKTLIDDPKANLDSYYEAEQYFSKFDKNYKENIEKISNSFGKMEKDTKLSVCIPVAGHQEEKNIYKSLENFSYQKIDPKFFEICLFVNHPDKDRDGKRISPDKTLSEIERFKKDHPEINIKVAYEVIPFEQANIGTVRKLLNDSVLSRHHERGKDTEDLIMISNDADNLGVAPEYLQNFLDKFEDNPKVDGMLGQLDWDPEAYVKYPAIHIGTRLFQYLNVLGRHNTERMSSSGGNFAFKSSIYAAIGGYMENSSGGEDIKIGQAIRSARGTHETIKFAGARVSRIYTSARRAIDALKSKLSPIEQWDKGFSPFDDEVRKLELGSGEPEDFDNPKTIEELKKKLEYIITRTLNVYEGGEKIGKDSPYYKRALGYLGVKCKIVNDEIVITDMSVLLRGLKRYQKEGVKLRDKKSGKSKKPAAKVK